MKARKLKLAWVVPSDRGGGVVWVADSCCRQAAADGHEVKLLTLERLCEATLNTISYPTESMEVTPPYTDTPARFIAWVEREQPDFVFLNNVDTMDCCIPYMPKDVRCVYVVHDTMSFYHQAAVRYQASLDAIVAVSDATAGRFRHKLKEPAKLSVIRNGTVFPAACATEAVERSQDLIFLGGDDPRKGAYDVMALWHELQAADFSGRIHWFGRIAGDFRARIDALGAGDQMVLHGHVPRGEVFDGLANAGAMLMLSRGEACSIALLEGMALGCIPIAWDIELTGTKEVVPRSCRFLAPLGDFEAMGKEVMRAVASGPEPRNELQRVARTHFSESRMWADYRRLIESIDAGATLTRPRQGQVVPAYRAPMRASHLIPAPIWRALRPRIASSAKLYYFLRSKL